LIGCTLDPRINRIAPINHVKSDKRDRLCLAASISLRPLGSVTAAERPGFVLALRSGSLGGRE
jgi:hypothetical protein